MNMFMFWDTRCTPKQGSKKVGGLGGEGGGEGGGDIETQERNTSLSTLKLVDLAQLTVTW